METWKVAKFSKKTLNEMQDQFDSIKGLKHLELIVNLDETPREPVFVQLTRTIVQEMRDAFVEHKNLRCIGLAVNTKTGKFDKNKQ